MPTPAPSGLSAHQAATSSRPVSQEKTGRAPTEVAYTNQGTAFKHHGNGSLYHLCPWLDGNINKGQEEPQTDFAEKPLPPEACSTHMTTTIKDEGPIPSFVNHRSHRRPPEFPKGPTPVSPLIPPRHGHQFPSHGPGKQAKDWSLLPATSVRCSRPFCVVSGSAGPLRLSTDSSASGQDLRLERTLKITQSRPLQDK